MTWKEFLREDIESAYTTTGRLLDKVEADTLEWKPATGQNWMTVSQLLKHISEGCGAGFRAFLTGDWGLPEGVKIEDLPPEEMLPPAEKLPRIASVAEARRLLCEDKALALELLDRIAEEELQNRKMAAPWAPGIQRELGRHLCQIVEHLERHKGQLFYYLKLQGKPVNTADLWGQ